ncbi:MerR family transcriptional regulator [Chamaesiphon sp.]|uniref:MerR family transcriptional regulator n=1 Tax=Chamaesiphon sp. TaxID=2814140 RepID=UPI00359383A0
MSDPSQCLMFLTSKEAADISGCTLRQLQYWREQGVVVPTVDATGRGRSVFYTQDDLVALMVMAQLLSAGLDYVEARAGLGVLKEKEPEFFNASTTSRYFLTRINNGDRLVIKEFEVEAAQKALINGQTVIPLWLDQLHEILIDRINCLKGKIIPPIEIDGGPEENAKNIVDRMLHTLGWSRIHYERDLETGGLESHIVEEYRVATGIVDYALFVRGLLIGIIEVKRLKGNLDLAMEQAKQYSKGSFDGVGNWRGYRVPFLYASDGEIIYFCDIRDESNLVDVLPTFHTPQALIELLNSDRPNYSVE